MEKRPLVYLQVVSIAAEGAIGTYFLGKIKDSVPQYVGRSDTDLRRRLLQHLSAGRFDWFAASLTQTANGAFYLECRGWHSLRGLGIRNLIHPASPAGLPIRCPFCDFVEAMAIVKYVR